MIIIPNGGGVPPPEPRRSFDPTPLVTLGILGIGALILYKKWDDLFGNGDGNGEPPSPPPPGPSPGPGPGPGPSHDCENPAGDEGDTICRGKDLYMCKCDYFGGCDWVLIKKNTVECREEPPSKRRCKNPPGEEGDTICKGSDLYECRCKPYPPYKCEWRLKRKDAPECDGGTKCIEDWHNCGKNPDGGFFIEVCINGEWVKVRDCPQGCRCWMVEKPTGKIQLCDCVWYDTFVPI